MTLDRRELLLGGTAALATLAGCAADSGALLTSTAGGMVPARTRVLVVGGGYGGATAAKYLRLWDPAIEVVLVERASLFTSCPLSNLVLAGFTTMDDIRQGYDGLRRHGVQVVNDEVTAIDAGKKLVRLEGGGDLSYDRLVVSPGIDFTFGEIQDYEPAMKAVGKSDWMHQALLALSALIISPAGYLLTKWLGHYADSAAAALFHAV